MHTVRGGTGLVAIAMVAWSGSAHAQVKCSSLTPAPIYVSGSTALQPMIQALAAQGLTQQFAIVYVGDGSCNGVQKFVTTTAGAQTMILPSTPQSKIFALDSTYTDASKTPPSCIIDQPVPANVAISDVFVEVCTGGTPRPNTVGDILGPTQAMSFVVPAASTQKAISAEMAYLIFGLGAMGDVMPWTDPSFFFIRDPSSGTINLLGKAINVPAASWWGVRTHLSKGVVTNNGSGDVFNFVAGGYAMMPGVDGGAGNPEQVIGILGNDKVDATTTDAMGNNTLNRTKVKGLAFRWFNQTQAYWPDAHHDTYDKRNVRDGHYAAFGYGHLIATIDANTGLVTDPKAKAFIDTVTGDALLPGVDYVKLVGNAVHLIPQCAMRVKRQADGGDLSPFTPDKPCGCYFESVAPPMGAPTVPPIAGSCAACTAADGMTDPACGMGKCRNKFCESR